MDPMTIAAMVSMISSLGSGIAGSINGPKEDKRTRDALRTQQEYMNASVDPNHPWTQALSSLIKDQLQQEAASGLSEEMRQRRRLLSAGRLPAGMDTSRRDEAQSGAISRAFMDASKLGMQGALQRLGQAAGQQGSIVQGWSQYGAGESLNSQTQQANMANLGQSGPFALANLYKMFQGMGGGASGPVGSYGGDAGRLSGVNPSTGQFIVANGMMGGGV